MFPYVCLATMPLFCDVNWPRKFAAIVTKKQISVPNPSESCIYEPKTNKKDPNATKQKELTENINWKHKLVVCLLLSHCGLQIFLPYSHFLTKVFYIRDLDI